VERYSPEKIRAYRKKLKRQKLQKKIIGRPWAGQLATMAAFDLSDGDVDLTEDEQEDQEPEKPIRGQRPNKKTFGWCGPIMG
jgi:hypothetical protein